MMLAVMLTAMVCTEVAAQGFGFQRESFPEGSYSPVTNVNRNGYPRVLSDGIWTVTTKPRYLAC